MSQIERLFEGGRAVPGMRSAQHAGRGAVGDSANSGEDPAKSIAADLEPETVRVAPPNALSVIDPVRLRPAPELLYARDPTCEHSERVRLLRTELLLSHAHPSEPNAVALLSACPGEGRSLLAAELALSFAQFNRPTLLVDVDFRRPRQHLLFGSLAVGGLAQAIADERPPSYQMVEGFPNLALVTAGVRPDNPLELLMDWRFENLLQQWRREFEFIVLDTPAVSEFADALAVATVVGRVLLVYRARHTPQKSAREMLRRLAATDAHIVGGALNHF